MYNAPDTWNDDPAATNPWGLERARVISLVSQKGGVGKTTSAVNLGAAFALSGHRVLLIGVDPQCGITRSLGYTQETLRGGLREALMSGMSLDQIVHDTPLERMSMVVPDAWSLGEEKQYKQLMEHSGHLLGGAVAEARDRWDTILIDCPPGFGPETRAAISASEAYLVPVQAEELCRDTLPRLLQFIDDNAQNQDRTPPRLEGLFMTMIDTRTRMSRHVADSLDRDFSDDLFERAIPRNTRLAEMALQGRPTVIYDRRSTGSRAYFDLVDEIALRWLHREAETPAPETVTTSATLDQDLAYVPSPGPEERSAGSLARLLQDLTGETTPKTIAEPSPGSESTGWDEPELVSLDQLIEEEESGADASERNYWGLSDDEYDTVN